MDNSSVARGLAYPDYEDPHNSGAGDKTGRRATHGTSGLEGVRVCVGVERSAYTLRECDLVA